MTIFWQRWLTLWSAAVALFGLVLLGAGFAATSAPSEAIFAFLGSPLSGDFDRHLRFSTSLMGAVTFGWGATCYIAFRALWLIDRNAAAPLWRSLMVATIIWYVIDSTASVATGFALNAVSNTLFTVAFLVPLFATRAMATD
jgi:hypothetical protein